MHEMSCVVCGHECRPESTEVARVRSNVRAFIHESFELWRCSSCASIHARHEADLPAYYAQYPFHALQADWRLDVVYANLLRRLCRAGLRRRHKLLDYGCGSGAFVRYLRRQGYTSSAGFDAYSSAFANPAVLEDEYDFIVAQDTIEHVDSPAELMRELQNHARPGAVIAIGTPDAAAIDLGRAEEFVHTLHAPYHRHILSGRALFGLARDAGWALERRYDTMYTNTLVPGLNEAFYAYYARLQDDTLDAILGPVETRELVANLPQTLYVAFFGSWLARGTDTLTLFRCPV